MTCAKKWRENFRLLGVDVENSVIQKFINETYHIEIEENSYVAGMNKGNLGKTFCDFQAGFFTGRLHILINIDPTVQEIKCQGKGDEFCVFEIKVSSKMSMTNQ